MDVPCTIFWVIPMDDVYFCINPCQSNMWWLRSAPVRGAVDPVLTTLGGHDESQGIEITPTKVFATCEVKLRRSDHACQYISAVMCGTPLRYSLI